MKKWLSVLAGVLVVLSTGCATTKQIVPLPDRTKTISDPSKARIYLMRITGLSGGGMPLTAWDGEEKLGSLGPKGYLCWEREPGDTQIRVLWPGTIMATLPLKCEKGQTYYIRQRVKMGMWVSRCVLDEMPPQEGAKLVTRCKPPRPQ